MEHVFWIGGGPGAGKSTIARRLVAKHGLRLYDTDARMSDHARRARDAPHLERFKAMSMDERWLDRAPETMLDTFPWFRGEAFDLIVAELRPMPPVVVAEGFRLLPSFVAPLLPVPSHAVWLLPTPEFRRAALESRGDTWTIADRTSDPARALENLAERDRLFTSRLAAQTRELGCHAFWLHPGETEEKTFRRVEELFGL